MEHHIRLLLQETDYVDVISIIGMHGMGKTTVAWKIFNDPRIIHNFPMRIWLPISQQLEGKGIFLGILKQVTKINDDIRAKNEHDLGDLVRDLLERGIFLIVMDDVWSRSDWDRLRLALPYHNTKGKVLITGRFDEVGGSASSHRPCYYLRFFNPEESWELFRLEALHTLDCPPELEDVDRKITEYCKGLPLAIVVIAGMLAKTFAPTDLTATRRYWKTVSRRVCSYLDENSDPDYHMEILISLSYDSLSYHLRACFLYLGMFPWDYEISASKLIHMWIGEGFVQQEHDCTLEETAHKYLEDLIHRNLLKSDKFKADAKVKTCRIHRIVHDFCRREAADTNFLREIRCNSYGVFVPSVSGIVLGRRLSILSSCSKFMPFKPFGPRVRTLVCSSHEDKYALSAEDGANIIRGFPLLRILDVSAFKSTRIDKDLYKLVHMRYIAFSSDLPVLPSEFDKLWNIQTLIVDTTSRTLHVKADIWKMKRLRHFKTNASATLLESSVGEELSGGELQTLSLISVESCTEKLSSRACKLKKLGIRGKLDLLFDTRNGSFDSLGKMKKLGKLKLMNDLYPNAREGGVYCLPEPHRFPCSLTSLTLCATFLNWEHMSTLGFLKKLKVLKLKEHAFMGETWESVDGGFQSLEALHIEETDLVVWIASSHHYPNLRGLMLKNCEELLLIPIQLADIPTFQMFDLNTCNYAVAQSAKRISDVKKQAGGSEFLLSIYPPSDE